MEAAPAAKHVITIRWGREVGLEESSFDDSSLDPPSDEVSPRDELSRLYARLNDVVRRRDAVRRELDALEKEVGDIAEWIGAFRAEHFNK